MDVNARILWRQKAESIDLALCRIIYRCGYRPLGIWSFRLISRLGDGLLWYLVMIALPLAYGQKGFVAGLHMVLTGAICTLIYKSLKHRTLRGRPFTRHSDIQCRMPPLDYFSFPSGHTLHACAFTVLLFEWAPLWGWAILPFTVLVALSRMILGLHYPSDVIAGAAIGVGLGSASLWLFIALPVFK
ncbi:hypothetical protein BFW38_07045 [Terasakiispira papahanaumokuakeensis]|uniref:undecaprenyl-diphosphate phosphatase n=2 Tax=Terasakiispira papahanaumokuakeensis TaxID=197479 RepID=A0A1E2V8J7_9GAMM|nr:hypothetical protein BFW38_07045 [Terasakiispira papahanaumokuakeensis]